MSRRTAVVLDTNAMLAATLHHLVAQNPRDHAHLTPRDLSSKQLERLVRFLAEGPQKRHVPSTVAYEVGHHLGRREGPRWTNEKQNAFRRDGSAAFRAAFAQVQVHEPGATLDTQLVERHGTADAEIVTLGRRLAEPRDLAVLVVTDRKLIEDLRERSLELMTLGDFLDRVD